MDDETATNEFVSHFKDLARRLDLQNGKILYHDGMVGIGIVVRDDLPDIDEDNRKYVQECAKKMTNGIDRLYERVKQVEEFGDLHLRLECVIRAGYIRDLADELIERVGAAPTKKGPDDSS